jgi:alkanesulfonate monooxygenase SsuD/methylene tetrahydromethanopterin reductase-like flavin-dependent oxidoreductase (luciferase family)
MAAVTDRIKLGTGINLLAQRDPIWTAKEVATVDHLSNGRFIFGVGYGWNVEEMNHHGVDYATRRTLLKEKVLLMKALWTEDEASFAGEHPDARSFLGVAQTDSEAPPSDHHGSQFGPRTVADLVEFCDGWLPHAVSALPQQAREIRQALEDAGRDPEAFSLSIFGARAEQRTLDLASASNADRVVFAIESNDSDQVLEDLEATAGFALQ